MKKSWALLAIPIVFILFSFDKKNDTSVIVNTSPSASVIIPLGGNSWVSVKDEQTREEVTNEGWRNWQSDKAVFSTYMKVNTKGAFNLYATLAVPNGQSEVRCCINGVSKIIPVSGADNKEYDLGVWNIASAGYVKIDFHGVSKTGDVFANALQLRATGGIINDRTAFVKNNDDNYFLWGRRGPSVHLHYDVGEKEIQYFYSEVNVPAGNDVVGSYFMANGFGEGYFGMQVNSATERRVLFSVWSPFQTDDPSKIPEDKKIRLLKKGNGVKIGEFGNEGSGGQSYMHFNWKTGNTYKFLLKGEPAANNYTNYTAYFFAPETNQWQLIASFSRPATHTYLKGLYSFLENFNPETGYITRKALYQNQWIRDRAGKWYPINNAVFTGDDTAIKGYRLDYAGGTEGGAFFLSNCGFFNNSSVLNSTFSVGVRTQAPVIDLGRLE